ESVRSSCCSCTNTVASTKTWHLRLYSCSILAAPLAPLSEVTLLVGGLVPPSSGGHMCLLYQSAHDCYLLRVQSRGHSAPLLQLCFTCRFHCMQRGGKITCRITWAQQVVSRLAWRFQ